MTRSEAALATTIVVLMQAAVALIELAGAPGGYVVLSWLSFAWWWRAARPALTGRPTAAQRLDRIRADLEAGRL